MKTSKPLSIDFRAARRVLLVMLAAILSVSGLPLFWHGNASAAVQLTTRSIQMSDSAASGGSIVSGVGSGAAVKYQVSFTPTSQAASLVIDFCSNDPLIGDSCTAPTGFNASAAALNATAYAGTVQTTTDNWAVTASTSTIKITDDNSGGGVGGTHPTHDIQPATPQSFQITGITNPSTVGTFYARITTYNDINECQTNPGTGCYTGPASPNTGTYLDYGGIALSTAAVIKITARVQESLTFCITAAAPDTTFPGTGWTSGTPAFVGTCQSAVPGANPPTITIGHGSPTPILDSVTVDSTPVWDQLSTNATHGAIVNMISSNQACTYTGMTVGRPGGGLSADGGTTCAIPPINGGANTGAIAMVAGTAAFGLDVCAFTPTTQVPANATGALDPTAEYNSNVGGSGSACPGANYGMDTQTKSGAAPYPGSNGSVSTTYGSTIAEADFVPATPGPAVAGPIYAEDDQLTFAATAGLTTPAGIYTANLVLVATGTF